MASTGYFDRAATGSWNASAAGRAGALPSTANWWADVGIGDVLSAGGSIMSVIGTYFAAQTQKGQLKSQALSMEHEAAISRINARVAEQDAQAIEEAGREEAGNLALRYAQEKASHRASVGGSGVRIGHGSAAEVAASIQLAAEMDAITLNKNTVRAAGQRRMQATDTRNRGALADISANNLRATAGSVNPGLVATGSLLSQFGRGTNDYLRRRR